MVTNEATFMTPTHYTRHLRVDIHLREWPDTPTGFWVRMWPYPKIVAAVVTDQRNIALIAMREVAYFKPTLKNEQQQQLNY